jgi:hypothetical protein
MFGAARNLSTSQLRRECRKVAWISVIAASLAPFSLAPRLQTRSEKELPGSGGTRTYQIEPVRSRLRVCVRF